MKQPQPTQTLPEGYRQTGKLDLNENRGLGMILNLAGLGLLFGVGGLMMAALPWLRPAYLSTENILVITGLREFWRGLLLLAVSAALVFLLREGLHGLVLWAVTRQRPKLGFRGFYVYAAAPEWYLPRKAYTWHTLVPLVGITLLGLAATPVVPLNFVPGVLLVVALNAALAVIDLATLYWLSRQPGDVLVCEIQGGVAVFRPEA